MYRFYWNQVWIFYLVLVIGEKKRTFTFVVRAHCRYKFLRSLYTFFKGSNLYFRRNEAKITEEFFLALKIILFFRFHFKGRGVLDVELLLLIECDPPFLCFYTEPFKVLVFIAQSSKGKKKQLFCCAGKNDFSLVDAEYVYDPRWAHSPLSQMWYSRERRFLSNILNFLKLSVI